MQAKTSPSRRLVSKSSMTLPAASTLAIFLLLLAPVPSLAKEVAGSAAADASQLGKIDFPTSAGAEAQAHFERGVLFLHSFEYRDARAAFLAAQKAEPGFAMAHWGEAMTYNHPIWLQESLEEGREALAKLGATAEERRAKAPTAREKDFLGTVEILFGEGDKEDRDHAYAAALAAMRQNYPEDLEAASFHALALLGTCHDGRHVPTYMRAAAIAEEVYAQNPDHPGALHYLIHSYDDPTHAPLGLRAARLYAGIAPAAGHALHMPSHIFLALGMWQEVASSNEDSWQAVEAKVERENLPEARRNFHALQWLQYAYLQQGRLDEARELLDIMAAADQPEPSMQSRRYLVRMRAAWLADTLRWRDLPPGPELEDLPLETAALGDFTTGWASLLGQDIPAAEASLASLRGRIEQEDKSAETYAGDACAMAGSKAGFQRVGERKDTSARVLALQLDALLHHARGEKGKAVALLLRAAELEEALPFGFGPPMPAKPIRELMAEILLDLKRPAEAGEQLEIALGRTPRRGAALRAQLAVAKAVEDMELVARSEEELASIAVAKKAPRLSTGRP